MLFNGRLKLNVLVHCLMHLASQFSNVGYLVPKPCDLSIKGSHADANLAETHLQWVNLSLKHLFCSFNLGID